MAFIEDNEPSEPRQQYASPLMNYDTGVLAALILQFVSGGAALYYAVPGLITGLLLFSFITTLTLQIYMIVWGILPIVGIVQIYFGYRLYKKSPGIIKKAVFVNVFAILLFGVDIVISGFENLLFAYPEVLLYFGMNILLVILLNMESIRSQIGSRATSNQSEYFQY